MVWLFLLYNQSGIKDGAGIPHAEVYIFQIQQPEFQNSPLPSREILAVGMVKDHLVPIINDPKINWSSQVFFSKV